MSTHIASDLTAEQLGWIVREAFDDVNDIGGMTEACWTLVAKKVAEELKLRLAEDDADAKAEAILAEIASIIERAA